MRCAHTVTWDTNTSCDLTHCLGLLDTATWDLRCIEKRTTRKFFNNVAKNCSTLLFTTSGRTSEALACKEMLIDMPIGWGSTFLTLQRLVDFKTLVQDLGSLSQESYLNHIRYAGDNEMVQVLQISYAAAVSLQSQDLAPGECLLRWRKIIFNLEKLEKSLANDLATSLQARQLHILRNEAFLAAVWVSNAFYGDLTK